jgi:hypothetical protein
MALIGALLVMLAAFSCNNFLDVPHGADHSSTNATIHVFLTVTTDLLVGRYIFRWIRFGNACEMVSAEGIEPSTY